MLRRLKQAADSVREFLRPHRRKAIAIGVGLIIVVYLAEVRREYRGLSPHGHFELMDFANAMPPSKHVSVVRMDGCCFVVWIGERAGPLAVPSGSSCYIFDETGRLKMWCPDTGDGGPCDAFAVAALREPKTTVAKALTSCAAAD